MKISKVKVLNVIANFYIWLIRGTPMIVQALLVYFGLPQVIPGFLPSPFMAGIITLSLNAGAYLSEIFRSGIQAVPKGQTEAARSLGLSAGRTTAKIVLPQAFKIAVPPMVNQFIITLKDTSILTVIGMAEIVLLPESGLVGRLVSEAGFRSKYSVNIMGIRRKGEYIMDGLAAVRLHAGDVLLVQGTWASISRLGGEEEKWVVLGQPLEEAAKVTLDYKAPLAAFIMLAMVAMMVFDFIPVAPVTAVMIAAVLMVLTGCFRNVEAAYKTINWESVVLIAAMMPMSVALEKTGASSAISHTLVSGLGGYGPYVLLAGIYFTTSLLTMFISNTATAVLMAPIAFASATEVGLSPYPFLFAVALGASMCFASPFSTPPNALVMQAGRYTFMDYVKVGLPLQIVMGVVMVFVLPLLFPF